MHAEGKYMENNIFSSAKILVPYYSPNSENFKKWAVIACDQYTSEPKYWSDVESYTDNACSSYDYILPEAYLGTDREESKKSSVIAYMNASWSSPVRPVEPRVTGFMYVERHLSNGKIRRGILGKIDLEQYDFTSDSSSAVRATEQTVESRIPARRKMREHATIELPHIMVFANDKTELFDKAKSLSENGRLMYDFDLMMDGGRIVGHAIEGNDAEILENAVAENEKASSLPYAVGDGNHSLAAAKAHYENIKASLGDKAAEHPSRWALCEIVSIDDESVEFEPIYRIMKNVSADDVKTSLDKITEKGTDGTQTVTVIAGGDEYTASFNSPAHALTVGTLQNFIDEYVSAHEGAECDYIHGIANLRELAKEENTVAFLFDGIKKSELFDGIKDGPLPRKTFSMGDAKSKRYYLEARLIIIP